MAKVITFGELMLRLQPYDYLRFVQADSFEATFGGGEANVSVSLANYGMDSRFVTKLPSHAIGQMAVNSLRKYGVNTEHITRGGDRVGIYFLEKGASTRGSVCIYDRAHSAIAEATEADFDWDSIFEGADWFHFTGITPALGENVVRICKQACIAAKNHGVKISCDLNYRGKLWTREQARAAMTDLCQYVDVCKLLFATEKGQRVHADLDSAVRAAEQRIYGCFSTEELLTLDRLQRKLLKNLLSLMESEQKEVPNS